MAIDKDPTNVEQTGENPKVQPEITVTTMEAGDEVTQNPLEKETGLSRTETNRLRISTTTRMRRLGSDSQLDGRTKEGKQTHARMIDELYEKQQVTSQRISGLVVRMATIEKALPEFEERFDFIENNQDALHGNYKAMEKTVKKTGDLVNQVIQDQAQLLDVVKNVQDTTKKCMRDVTILTKSGGLDRTISMPTGGQFSVGKISPPVFEGKSNPIKYLREMENYCLALQVTGWSLQHALSSSLKGSANDWWHSVCDEVETVDEFMKKFKEEYWDQISQNKVRKDLEFGRYQTNGRLNRVEYARRIINNVRYLDKPPTEQEIIQSLSQHFPVDVQRVAMLGLVATTADFLKLLKQIDNAERPSQSNSNFNRNPNNNNTNQNENFKRSYENNPRFQAQQEGRNPSENKQPQRYQNADQNRGYQNNQPYGNYNRNNYQGNRQPNNYQGQRYDNNRGQYNQGRQFQGYNNPNRNAGKQFDDKRINEVQINDEKKDLDTQQTQEAREEEEMLQYYFPKN